MKTYKTNTRIFLSIAALLLLTSCSLLGKSRGPEVSLTSMALSNISLFETTAVFTVRIENDRDEAISLAGSMHKFYLNGDYIGKGFSKTAFNVPAYSSKQHQVQVHLSNISMLQKIQHLIDQPKVEYEIESNFRQEFGGRQLTSSRKGTISLQP